LGFKIKCSGRFSRKQRASSYWFSLGSVPLNSVTATIDYSMYTVPLANSAITIKVWIHRMNTVDNLFYIHLV
jgi:ribosomal protein S3